MLVALQRAGERPHHDLEPACARIAVLRQLVEDRDDPVVARQRAPDEVLVPGLAAPQLGPDVVGAELALYQVEQAEQSGILHTSPS